MCVFWRLKVYTIALTGSLELYNYANVVANGSIICKLSSLVALHELLFCDNLKKKKKSVETT